MTFILNYTFLILLLLCEFATAQTEKKPRVVTINMGFDCREFCTTLKGADADIKINDQTSQLIGAERTIHIDNETFEKYPDKQTLLKLLQQQTANYDVIVFNYSGHAIPFPKTEAGANKPATGRTDPKQFELLFMTEKYGACVSKESSDEQLACATDCGNKFNTNQCSAFATNIEKRCEVVRDELIAKGVPYFERESECYDNVPTGKKTEIDFCRQLLPHRLSCTTKCNDEIEAVQKYFTPIKDPLSAKNKACLNKYGILLSDLEPIFKGKKLFALVDTSNAGLISNINHDDYLISTATNISESAERFPTGGVFTHRKSIQLRDEYCKFPNEGSKQLTLSDFYKNSPNLWPFYVEPLVLDNQKSNTHLPLKGYYLCPVKKSRSTPPTEQDSRK